MGLESSNPDPLFLDDEVKLRKVLCLSVHSFIARQWPKQDKNQASWFPDKDFSTTGQVKLFFSIFSLFFLKISLRINYKMQLCFKS